MARHNPKSKAHPRPGSGRLSPSAVVGTPDYKDGRPPLFSFEHADREYEGNWSWATSSDADVMLEFMCQVSKLTWAEIHAERFGGGNLRHHEQDIDTVCIEAQARITELGHDQRFERLYRFGVGSRKRLWGFATEGVFYVLWWDANHQVYPTEMIS